MAKDDLLSHVNEGRTASIMLQWMDPLFAEVEQELVASLKSNFRAGTYTELLLACHVAQLCSIEDLKTKIRSLAHRGDSAAHELNRVQEEQPDFLPQ